MNGILKVVLALRAAGLLFSEIGELLKRLSQLRGGSNLEPPRTDESDQASTSQDSLNPCKGVKDEEPEGVQTEFEFGGCDLTETTQPNRSPSDP